MNIKTMPAGYKFPDSKLTFVRRCADIITGNQKKPVVLCACECGGTIETRLSSVRCGDAKSCGCLRRGPMMTEQQLERNRVRAEQRRIKAEQRRIKAEQRRIKAEQRRIKAEQRRIKAEQRKIDTIKYKNLYTCWLNMKQRCDNTGRPNYPYYGGLGISYDDDWKIFDNFKMWAVGAGWQAGLTLERDDATLNYCPENCSWETRKTQNRNRKNGYWWVIDNIAYESAQQASDVLGIGIRSVRRYAEDDAHKNIYRKPKYDNGNRVILAEGVSVYGGE